MVLCVLYCIMQAFGSERGVESNFKACKIVQGGMVFQCEKYRSKDEIICSSGHPSIDSPYDDLLGGPK